MEENYENNGANSNEVGLAKYLTVKEALLRAIEDREYLPSSKIPSENQISEMFNVSVITARKALQELVNAGVIYRVKGKGTFVMANTDAKSNGGGSSKIRIITLLLLNYESSDSSTMKIIRGAQQVLSQGGYNLTIECSYDDVRTEADILEKCISNRVDGVLLFSSNPESNLDALKHLEQEHIPFVLLDRGISQFPVSLVTSYNMDGGYRITRYLLENGHKKLLFAANDLQITTEKQRYAGFCMALSEAGLTVTDAQCVDRVLHETDVIVDRLKANGYTGIVCVNDKSAVKIMKTIKKAGYRIPEDVSITGFDDADYGKYVSPSLTTVAQPFVDMGRVAAQKLMDIIEGKSLGMSQEILPVEMIVRNSTRRLV